MGQWNKKSCSVVGAGGKMGSGIALLLLQAGAKVICYDTRPEAVNGLKTYLMKQLEKRDLGERIANATFTSELSDLSGTELLFEAIVEDQSAKVALFRSIEEIASPTYFTNTSSLPIGALADEAGIKGRLIGFHFYNPPAIQKLLELIVPSDTPDTLALEIARDLGKTVVRSADVAGFIGNGHFVREILFACEKVGKHSIETINRASQEWLIRPMGIFQLLDYVGIDVAQKILRVMDRCIEGETFHSDLIDEMLNAGIRGGQHSDGSQRDGFFRYEKGKCVAVYEQGKYRPLKGTTSPLPESHYPWKVLSKDPEREEKLAVYFQDLATAKGEEAALARELLAHSEAIGRQLVTTGVAQDDEAVNQILMLGFYHLYGPLSRTPVKK